MNARPPAFAECEVSEHGAKNSLATRTLSPPQAVPTLLHFTNPGGDVPDTRATIGLRNPNPDTHASVWPRLLALPPLVQL